MAVPALSIPLVPQVRFGDTYKLPPITKTESLTPIDEAVMAVREAQDTVGKDMWEDR